MSNQNTGNIGMYYVSYMLSLNGFNVLPTSRNAAGVDILAYSEDLKHTHYIQVKALTKSSPVPLGKSLDYFKSHPEIWWFIVVDVKTEKPTTYIMKSSEIIERAHKGERNGVISYWLQPKQYAIQAFKYERQNLLSYLEK